MENRCNKSQEHRVVQRHIHHQLPGTLLEEPFPQIGRIADVAWPAHRLIFEVQCSPIDVKEWDQRNRDYARLGYRVIWILHERTFNRAHLTPLEELLTPYLYFYTNINGAGEGEIVEVGRLKGRRLFRLPVQLSTPESVRLKDPVAKWWATYKQQVHCSFGGDFFDTLAKKQLDLAVYQELLLLKNQEKKPWWRY